MQSERANPGEKDVLKFVTAAHKAVSTLFGLKRPRTLVLNLGVGTPEGVVGYFLGVGRWLWRKT